MLEIFTALEKLGIKQDRPGLYIILFCIIALIYQPKIRSRILVSIDDFFDQILPRKYSKSRKFCEDPLTSEFIKNTAREEIERHNYRKLYGIDANEKLRKKIEKLANYSQDKCIRQYLRSSQEFLQLNDQDWLYIRKETKIEFIKRCYFYVIFALCFILFIFFSYLFIYLP